MLRRISALFSKKQPKNASKATSSSLSYASEARVNIDAIPPPSSSSYPVMNDHRQQQYRSPPGVHGSATAVNCVVIAEPNRCLSVSSATCQDNSEGATLVLSDPSNATVVHRWNVGVHHGGKEVTKVACCVEADVYATASRDKTVNIWARNGNAPTSPVGRCVGHELVVTGVAVDGTATKMFSGSRDNTVRLWNVDTGVCVRKTALAQNLVTHVRWGSGDRVAQSSEDKMVHVWDVRNMEAVISTAPKHHIQTWCDVDDPYILASSNGFSGSGCETTLWDARAASRPVREFRGHFETVIACCFVRGERQAAFVATCSRDGTVRLWDRDTGDSVSVVASPEAGQFTAMASYSDVGKGPRILVSSVRCGIEVWSVSLVANSGASLMRTAAF